MSDDLIRLLDSYAAETLREMAEFIGIAITMDDGRKIPKQELVPTLRAELFAGPRILSAYNQLTSLEQAVLNRLLLRGGQMPTRRFQQEIIRAGLGKEAPQQSHRYYSGVPYADGYVGQPHRESRIFEDIIARLTRRGLVFSQDATLNTGGNPYKLRFHPAAQLIIPAIIQKTLPTPEPLPVSSSDWRPQSILRDDPTILLRDLYLYWDFARHNEMPLLASGLVGKRQLKVINDSLLRPDPLLDDARREDQTGRLYLLRLLLQGLGLLKLQPGRLATTAQNDLHIPDFWSKSQVEQIHACTNLWLKLDQFADYVSTSLTQYGATLSTARQAILRTIAALPVEQWTSFDELATEIQLNTVNFLFPDRADLEQKGHSYYYHSRYSVRPFYGEPKQLLALFNQLETNFVKACLTGMMFQLGLVELGSEQPEAAVGSDMAWSYYRLTETGQALLGLHSALPPVHEGKLLVQPNFQVMAMGPVGLDMLARLDLFAQREQADRGVFQYRLSRESVYQAQQAGLTAADIIKFLQQAGQAELPQNVRRSLEEWGSHHERIVFRQGIDLLQAATPALLKKLLAAELVGSHLARAVAEDMAVVKSGQTDPLVKQLVTTDLLPVISDANPQAADQSVLLDQDGLLKPIHAVPSLHLRGRLAQFAEELDDGRWQLTAALVRRAGGSKSKVLRLLDDLARLHRGPLPDKIITQLKAWGGYYGNAATETLTLIEFRDHDTMAELLAQPDLQAKLTPFPTTDRAIASVAPGDLGAVKTTLISLGIDIKGQLPR